MNILVIGSINQDLFLTVPRFAQTGETLLAASATLLPGGKGANQAVAASRLGASVRFIGALGSNHEFLSNHLAYEKINCNSLIYMDNQLCGQAVIIACNGENQIIVDAGANAALAPEHFNEDDFVWADLVLCQLETPIKTVQFAAKIAKKYQKCFILNTAPAQTLPYDLLQNVDYFILNEHEYAGLAHQLDSTRCIVTLGAQGVRFMQDEKMHYQRSFVVDTVDSTGAGDTFCGALATFWHLGLTHAVRLACAAAALSVTHYGAQSAMPHLTQLHHFLAHNTEDF